MILTEVLFLNFKGSIEEVLLLVVVAKLSIGTAQVVQRPRHLQMILSQVFYIDLQRVLEHFLGGTAVFHATVETAQVIEGARLYQRIKVK